MARLTTNKQGKLSSTGENPGKRSKAVDSQDVGEVDANRGDEVLRRMLKTPPATHETQREQQRRASASK